MKKVDTMASCQASSYCVELLKCEEAFNYQDTELLQAVTSTPPPGKQGSAL